MASRAFWVSAFAFALVLVSGSLTGAGLGLSSHALSLRGTPSAVPVGAAQLSLASHSLRHGAWSLLSPAKYPTNRDQIQMAYDPGLREVILFGGYDPGVYADGDTWAFHGGNWTDLTANLTAAPSARWGGSFTYDPAIHALVLFGGRDVGGYFNDTWTFTHTGWHNITTAGPPSPRRDALLVYDAFDHYLLLWGGALGNVPAGSGSPWYFYNDTWQLSGHRWVNITASVRGSPPHLGFGPGAAYDPSRSAVVGVFGVTPAAGKVVKSYTWVYRSGTWTNLSAGKGPPMFYAGGVVWDASAARIVLVGQSTSGPFGAVETWAYSTTGWHNLTAAISGAPGTRGNSGLAWDSLSHQLVMFGGDTPASYAYSHDTWVLS